MKFFIDSSKEDFTKERTLEYEYKYEPYDPYKYDPYKYEPYKAEAGNIHITFLKRDLMLKFAL